MIINQPDNIPQDSESFATNWYENANNIFQLIVSDYIWQKYGFNQKKPVSTIRKQFDDINAIVIDEETGDLITGILFDPQQSKWVLYANKQD